MITTEQSARVFLVDPKTLAAPMPRVLRARAARLLSSVIEVTLDLHGLDVAKALLDDPQHCRTLSALAGGPLDDKNGQTARAFVFAALARGLDADRLGLSLDDDTLSWRGRLQPRALARVLHVERPDTNPRVPSRAREMRGRSDEGTTRAPASVIALPRAAPGFDAHSVDARLLGALMATARAPAATSEGPLFERLTRDPGLGMRTRFALAIVALRVAMPEADFSPSMMALALGNVDGAPYGVALRVYDRVLAALETLLHAPGTKETRPRGAPLLALAVHVLERRHHAPPYRTETAIKRERTHARDFAAFTREGPVASGTRAPAIPRRRLRVISRRPGTWVPLLASDDAALGAFGLLREVQVDLFAP